ncbi:MAG: L-lactate dehydrogenase complex protein LldF [Limisphaerales bacterium]|jgi:L-lactate dehydrogenase complex protein LldF
MAIPKQFLEKADQKAHDQAHKHKLRYNIGKYDAKVIEGKKQYADIETAKKQAKRVKWKAIHNLDEYLLRFESRFEKRGGKVIWANNTEEALSAIGEIAAKHKAKTVVKSKSMATEEIELNSFLESKGITVDETDLGEYIQQLDGEKPYHIVTPAMHKSKEDVAELFHRKLGTDINLSATELTLVARRVLRDKYTEADIGITGANFIVADVGGIAITENEGNARLTIGFPKVHIAIVGIEKMIPSMEDLGLFWPLLSTFGTGQELTVYNSIITGPKQAGETDGPDEMYVVLLDNGRTQLLAEKEQREALYCIRCGACLNACPVYKNIGGHTYDTTYSGPIGSVITPHLQGKTEFGHLSYASSLCGSCTDVCPVKIDIHELLLLNRRDTVEEGYSDWTENLTWKAWKIGMLSRTKMNLGGASGKNFLLRTFFKGQWGERRDLPQLAAKSFNQQWKDKKLPTSKPSTKKKAIKNSPDKTATRTVKSN